MSLSERLVWRLLPLLPLAAILLGWTIYWNVAHPVAATLPPVSGVIAAFVELVASGRLADDIAASLLRLSLGASIGIVTGVVLAGSPVAIRTSHRGAAAFFSPLIVFFNAISGIVWLPLMIGWLGIGTALAVFLILEFGILHRIPEHRARRPTGAGAFGAERPRRSGLAASKTLQAASTLPGALPHILTGIRSGLGFGWRALIAAELVGATTGLGQMIFSAAECSRSDIIIVGCLIIGWHRHGDGPLAAVADRAPTRAALGPGGFEQGRSLN